MKFVFLYLSTDLQEVTSKKTVMSKDTMCRAFYVVCRAFCVLCCALYVLGCAFYVLGCAFCVLCCAFYVLCYSFYVLCILCVMLCILCVVLFIVQGGSNMTGTDFCVNKPHMSRSYLNHLVYEQYYFLPQNNLYYVLCTVLNGKIYFKYSYIQYCPL